MVMKKKKLLRMIDDLEIEAEFRKAAVVALAHAVKPIGFRFNYLMYVVNEGFTAKEFYGMETFWRDVCRWCDSAGGRGIYPVTRQSVMDRFNDRIPTRAGKLEEILKVDRADGDMGVFHLLSKIVLDEDPSIVDKDEEIIATDDEMTEPESKP